MHVGFFIGKQQVPFAVHVPVINQRLGFMSDVKGHRNRFGENRGGVGAGVNHEKDVTVVMSGDEVFFAVVVPVNNVGFGPQAEVEVFTAELQQLRCGEHGGGIGAGIQVDVNVTVGVADDEVFFTVFVPVHDAWTSTLTSPGPYADNFAGGGQEFALFEDRRLVGALVEKQHDLAFLNGIGKGDISAENEVLFAVVVPVHDFRRSRVADGDGFIADPDEFSRL